MTLVADSDWHPPFQVSVHHRNFDHVRWSIMKHGRYYEKDLERIWRQVLRDATASKPGKPIRVLDVGGNIGYFSLVSLAMGPNVVVDTFEPNPVNHLRMCESLELNGWLNDDDSEEKPRARLHAAGVSDSIEHLGFFVPRNPGAARFYPLNDPFLADKNYSVLPLVTLDAFAESQGWVENDGENLDYIAILKIDVEGLDSEVLRGARKLLAENRARNVFMEVFKRSTVERQKGRESLEMLVEAGYKLAGWGLWQGPGLKPPPEWSSLGNDRLIESIISAEPKARGLNLWWSLDDKYTAKT